METYNSSRKPKRWVLLIVLLVIVQSATSIFLIASASGCFNATGEMYSYDLATLQSDVVSVEVLEKVYYRKVNNMDSVESRIDTVGSLDATTMSSFLVDLSQIDIETYEGQPELSKCGIGLRLHYSDGRYDEINEHNICFYSSDGNLIDVIRIYNCKDLNNLIAKYYQPYSSGSH